ncbi:MAG: YegS/Rv2252/BmrU family lipid kinase [Prevotellaceae bacterium]|jgi:YegS/Rv2252/BmrU family lipid kinase|nr:YegS/Rv2252/BmrU family lipid kinase [Prevotellaceae bacterium]
MKLRIAYLINPASGTNDKKIVADYIAAKSDPSRFASEIYFTRSVGDATLKAAEFAAAGFDRVVAVGGDGTVNEVAKGLTGTAAALGIIPMGSGNGLARHIKMSRDYHKALAAVQNGKIITADYGLLNDKPFFCTAGIGFDAQVGKRFAQIGRRGLVSYAQASFEEYLRYRPAAYKITADGETFSRRAFLVTFANASQWGYNAYISPDANLTDGKIDLVVIGPFNFVKAPIIGLRMFTKSIYHSSNIEVFRVKNVTVEREKPGWIHIDGEPMTDEKILNVAVVPGKLRMIVPQ